MFAITAGYHRYFSHRSFKTGRVFAFVLAFLAQTSAQRGVLWWASNHRDHHRYSDTERDVHSPVLRSFLHAHVGWIFHPDYARTDYGAIPDFAKFPELVWLDKHPYLPAIITGLLVWLALGWSGLVVGFFWSTVALWHATFAINSLAHLVGRQRYLTGDRSRNNWWLALLTLGEGWHNNHHHYQTSVRQGFRWYEIDITYYVLRALAAAGLVWDLRKPPREVIRNEQPLGKAIVDKAARQLAASFQIETTATDLRARLREKLDHLDATLEQTQDELATRFAEWSERADDRLEALRVWLGDHLHEPQLHAIPSREELRARAAEMFVRAPSLDEIVDRARQLVAATLGDVLFRQPALAKASRRT